MGPKLDGSLGLRGPRTQWLWVLYELSLSKVVDAGKVTLSLTATVFHGDDHGYLPSKVHTRARQYPFQLYPFWRS